MTDTPACKYSLPELGIAILSFHLGSARSSNDLSSLWFYHRLVVHDDPESA